MNCHRIASFFTVLVALQVSRVAADVKLPKVLGSGMVLQRDMKVPIWGWADPGERLTIRFAGQTKETKAGEDGKWIVKLEPLKANANPGRLSIVGKNKVVLDDVLVGEVWICSGQSNMEWPLASSMNAKAEIAAANHHRIRLFNVPGHTTSPLPRDEGRGQWRVCTPQATRGFSAVGYFFGRRLQKELKVPIGLVGSNWGGTRIEPWTTLAGFESVPELTNIARQVKSYKEDTKVGGGSPSAIYNSMVHPLTPLAMRGAIWYQGEANGGEGLSYYHKKHALVNGWRKAFQNKDLAFYWVQLANWRQENPNPAGGDGWARIREAQTKALDIPGTGMAVITDIGAANDIHPRNKQDVGWRLAQWALHQTYGKRSLIPSGPLFKSQKIEGRTIRISFKHVGQGLMVGKKDGLKPTAQIEDGKLEHFAIAGKDRKWFWAKATIEGNTVVVQADEVPEPVAVRYGFAMNPAKANLYNKDGFPAGAFRTDNWPRGGRRVRLKFQRTNKTPAKSRPGSATVVVFRNGSTRNVKIYWITYDGKRKLYGSLKPKGVRRQPTYANAKWLITDEKDKPLGYFSVGRQVGIAIIPK